MTLSRLRALSDGRNGLILLCSLMFAFFFCVMPRYVDDFWYSQFIVLADGFSPGAIADTWKEHYFHDNGRLSNIMYVPFLYLSKWCGSGIAALTWAWVLFRIPRMQTVWRHGSVAATVLFLFLISFGLPWYDSIGAGNYQFNYVISTALTLLVIDIFLRPGAAAGKRCVALFLCGLVAGAWHEGFSIPAAAALTLLLLLRPRRYRHRRQISLLAGLYAGIVWIVAAPSFLGRLQTILSGGGHSSGGSPLFVLALHPAFFLMAALGLAVLLIPQARRRMRAPLVLILLVSAFVSLLIHLGSTRPPRTGWWSEFASIVLIVMESAALYGACRASSSLRRLSVRAFALLLGVLTFAHLAMVDYYSLQIRRSFDSALAFHRANPSQTVFADIVTEEQAPLLCMQMPDFTLFTAPVNMEFVNTCLHPDGSDPFIPVPRQLRDATAASGQAVAGNAGCRILDGFLFAPSDTTGYGEFEAAVDFGRGPVEGVRMVYHSFVSPADGKRYVWLYPWRRVIEMRTGTGIVSVDRTDRR